MGALIGPAQSQRLTRKPWSSIMEFAQELQTLFESDAPYVGPTINIQQQGDQTVINIIPGNTPAGGSPIAVGPPPGPTDTNPPLAGGGNGDPETTTIDVEVSGLPAAFPLTAWGIIQSKSSNNIYNVAIYLENPATATPLGTMQVTQRQIDFDDEIPAGTETPVVLWTQLNSNGTLRIVSASMQVPVFLERA